MADLEEEANVPSVLGNDGVNRSRSYFHRRLGRARGEEGEGRRRKATECVDHSMQFSSISPVPPPQR